MLSDNLIHQEQTIGENSYHIVTFKYHTENDKTIVDGEIKVTTLDENKVNEIDEEVKLIEKDQVNKLLEGLSQLGLNDISQASTMIGAQTLIEVAHDTEKAYKVEQSAILCTIMSNLLLHSSAFSEVESYYQYTHYKEYCACDSHEMEILSFEDIDKAFGVVRILNPLS